MVSGPINSWQIYGEKMVTMTDIFFCRCSKTTADGDCRGEILKFLFLGRKVMADLDCILKSRDITLLTKVITVKSMVFPVVMFIC